MADSLTADFFADTTPADKPENQDKHLLTPDFFAAHVPTESALPPAPERPGFISELGHSLDIGAQKYAGLPLAGLTEMAGRATGIKALEDAGRAGAENIAVYLQDKEQVRPAQRFQDIGSVGDAGHYVNQQIGEFLPQAVLMFATGGAGGAAGKVAGTALLKRAPSLIPRLAGKEAVGAAATRIAAGELTGEQAAQALTAHALENLALRGAQAGNAANAIGMEASTIYQGQEDGKKNVARALAAGTGAGIIDTAVPNWLMEKTGLWKLVPGVKNLLAEGAPLDSAAGKAWTVGSRAKDIARTAGVVAPLETGQEMLQTVIEHVGSDTKLQSDEARKRGFWNVAKEKGLQAAVDPDTWDDIIESGAAGGTIGLFMGGGASTLGHVAGLMEQRQAGLPTSQQPGGAGEHNDQRNGVRVDAQQAGQGNAIPAVPEADTPVATPDRAGLPLPEGPVNLIERDTAPAAEQAQPKGVLTRAVDLLQPQPGPDMQASPVTGGLPTVPASPDASAAPVRSPEEIEKRDAAQWAHAQVQAGNRGLMRVTGEDVNSYTQRIVGAYRKRSEQPNQDQVNVDLVDPTGNTVSVPAQEVMTKLVDGWSAPIVSDSTTPTSGKEVDHGQEERRRQEVLNTPQGEGEARAPGVEGAPGVLHEQEAIQLVDGWQRRNRDYAPDLMAGELESNPHFREIEADGSTLQAHGMAKSSPAKAIRDLFNLFRNGINNSEENGRRGYLDSAPLTARSGEGLVGATAAGTAYRDGAFVLVAREGVKQIRNISDVAGVLVNPAIGGSELVSTIQAALPAGVMVRNYSGVKDIVAHAKKKDAQIIANKIPEQSQDNGAGNVSLSGQQDNKAPSSAPTASPESRVPSPGSHNFLTEIRKAGGIPLPALTQALDVNEVRGPSGKGNRYLKVTNAKGVGMDVMARQMLDAGWPVPVDPQGNPDADGFAQMLKSAVNGKPPVHPADTGAMERQAQAEEEQYLSAISPEEQANLLSWLEESVPEAADLSPEELRATAELIDYAVRVIGMDEVEALQTRLEESSPSEAAYHAAMQAALEEMIHEAEQQAQSAPVVPETTARAKEPGEESRSGGPVKDAAAPAVEAVKPNRLKEARIRFLSQKQRLDGKERAELDRLKKKGATSNDVSAVREESSQGQAEVPDVRKQNVEKQTDLLLKTTGKSADEVRREKIKEGSTTGLEGMGPLGEAAVERQEGVTGDLFTPNATEQAALDKMESELFDNPDFEERDRARVALNNWPKGFPADVKKKLIAKYGTEQQTELPVETTSKSSDEVRREKVHEGDTTTLEEMGPLGEAAVQRQEGTTGNLFAGVESVPVAAPAETAKTITDFGEKIGGARKDTAERGFSMNKKSKSEDTVEPWRKKYVVLERVDGSGWTIGRSDDKRGFGTRSQTFATKSEAEAAIPIYAVAEKHQIIPNLDKTTWSIWKKTGERKRLKVVNQDFPLREEAMRYMAEHAVELLNLKTSFGEEILPTPEKSVRRGVERRTGPSTPEMFMETFQPRGIEFGNWNNQDERQQVMDHAYDGLLDLADVLGVPPKALMLNGDLAIAFGARGQGLSGVKAHYERSYGVINLTKMSGAGSLAHEWMHALDHYLARQDTKAKSVKEKNDRGDLVYPIQSYKYDFMSHGESYKSQVRKELQEAYRDLIETMYRKAEQYVEDTRKADEFVGTARKELQDRLNEIRSDLARDYTGYAKANGGYRRSEKGLKPATSEQLAEFDKLASILVEGGDLATTFRYNSDGERPDDGKKPSGMKRSAFGRLMAGRNSNDTLDAISAIYKAVRGRSGFATEGKGPLDRLRTYMSLYAQRLQMFEDAETGTEKTKKVPTGYAIEARKMDQARTGDYWSEPHEMVARAFSAYVEDKVAEAGGQSDFLVYRAHGGILLPMIDGFVARPYPEGKERQAINAAFDKFVGLLQTRETPTGVALYSLAEPFYSKLQRVVADKMPRRMAAPQLIAMLKNNGVTDAEIDAVLPDVRSVTGFIDKEQVQGDIEANTAEFQDVILGENGPGFDRKAEEEQMKKELFDEAMDYDFADGNWWYESIQTRKDELLNKIKKTEQITDMGDDENDVYQFTYDGKTEKYDGWGPPTDDEILDLFDLDNEAIFETIPYEERKEGAQWAVDQTDFNEALDVMEEAYSNENPDGTHFSQYTEPGGKGGSYKEMFVTAPSASKKVYMRKLDIASDVMMNTLVSDTSWHDGHSQYSEINNPVVRIRFNERGIAGKRILFVEEMQGPSDSNQQKMPEALRRRIYDIGTKRILAYAKQRDFDGVAWTTGEMQANRYDLSKQVGRIEYRFNSKFPDDGGLLAYDHSGKEILKENGVSKDKLQDYIGKEAARKLIETETVDQSGLGGMELSGLDLKVGGEGLKRLYDQTLPALFKKYGGEQIEQTKLADGREVSVVPITERTPATYSRYAVGDTGTLTSDALNRITSAIARILPADSTRLDVVGTIRHADEAALKAHGVETGVPVGLHQTVQNMRTGDLHSVITLALNGATERTGYHEILHAAQALGIVSASDQKVLDRIYPDKNGKQAAERQADAFAAYALGEKRLYPNPVKALFAKVLEFVKRLGNVLKGEGWRTADDVFADLFAGKFRDVPAVRKMTVQQAMNKSGTRDSGLGTSNDRYSLATAAASVRDAVGQLPQTDSILKTLNPLDWSRFSRFSDEFMPPAVSRALAYLVRTPVFEAEADPRKQPFVTTAEEREVDRMDILLRFLDYRGAGPHLTAWQRLKKWLTTWDESDPRTSWGELQNRAGALPEAQRKALDTLFVEGDINSRSYSSLARANQNPRIRETGLTADTFSVYRDIRDHMDRHVSAVRAQMFAQLYLEAAQQRSDTAEEIASLTEEQRVQLQEALREWSQQGNVYRGDERPGHLPEAVWSVYRGIRNYVEPHIIRSIAEARRRNEELRGWMHRNHGDGEWTVKVHQTIDRITFDVNRYSTGMTARLPFYPGTRIAGELEKIGDALKRDDPRFSFIRLGNGQIIATGNEESVNRFIDQSQGIDLADPETGDLPRVLTAVRYVATKTQADKLTKEWQTDLSKAMPTTYRQGMTYDVKPSESTSPTEAMYGDVNDRAVEMMTREGLKKALNRGEVSREEFARTMDEVVWDTAEILMGRAAGRYQIRRADYLIEGYDRENAVQLFRDYQTAVAGQFSKIIYAMRQNGLFRKADGHTQKWAYQYIDDSLRNQGAFDRASGVARSIATFMYLGLKPASVVVNSTQPWTLGVAELGKITKSPMGVLFAAQRDIFRDNLTRDERVLFESAVWKTQEMETASMEAAGIHEGGFKGKVGRNWQTLVNKALGPFQEVELLNRKSVILAGYRVLRSGDLPTGQLDAGAMNGALQINRVVNGEMSRANLPGFARNPIGRTVYALQSFGFLTLNWVYNRLTSGQKEDMQAVLRFVGMTALIGGALAVPGGDEFDKLYRRLFGKSLKLEAQTWMRRHLREYGTPGEALYAFVWHGSAGLTGVNISNSLRVQMPFISPLLDGDSLPESLGGVYTGLIQKSVQAGKAATRGDYLRAAENLAPEAIAAPLRAWRQATRGVTTMGGKAVFDAEGKPVRYTTGEAVTRALGFQPMAKSDQAATTRIGQELQTQWSGERKELLDSLRVARTVQERKDVVLKIMRWNRSLRESQAFPLVKPITADSIRRAQQSRADKNKVQWQRQNG